MPGNGFLKKLANSTGTSRVDKIRKSCSGSVSARRSLNAVGLAAST